MHRLVKKAVLGLLAVALGVLVLWGTAGPVASQGDGPLARAEAHLRANADRFGLRPDLQDLGGDQAARDTVPDPVDTDDDNDGFSDTVELSIGTDHLDPPRTPRRLTTKTTTNGHPTSTTIRP